MTTEIKSHNSVQLIWLTKFMYNNTLQINFDFLKTCENKLTVNVFLKSIHIIRRTGGEGETQ